MAPPETEPPPLGRGAAEENADYQTDRNAQESIVGPAWRKGRRPTHDLLTSARWFLGPKDGVIVLFCDGRVELWLTDPYRGLVVDTITGWSGPIEAIEATWDEALDRLDRVFRAGGGS
ncbi:hypothetical protein FFK22_002245 [Mycobacterium sp. KBS0706]|uniref:hypothetical protein n=1 Tax=Mycobacterium sp. KBS0706 TaxID=2578109 RepID=UPI00110F9996|nr:hypothetical protein [Mycobacterium sp. KBS0706]TSD90294.1 hypothetical protein FFK22_002245 [Mycobacterium sp. KBS0706]